MIRRKHRTVRKNYQALTELAVSLIAFLVMIVGFLMISGLGTANLENLISAREGADKMARNGLSGADGQQLRTWSYGADNLPFTQDDMPVSGSNASGDTFRNEMQSSDQTLDLTNRGILPAIPAENNFAPDLAPSRFFLSAAMLAGYSSSENDPLTKRNLASLKKMIAYFFGADFKLCDSVFMPQNQVNNNNEL